MELKHFFRIDGDNLLIGHGLIVPFGFTEFSPGQEPQMFIEALAVQKQKDDLQNSISECIDFLNRTDHKMSIDYEPTPDEDIEQIKVERIAKRRFIRENRNA